MKQLGVLTVLLLSFLQVQARYMSGVFESDGICYHILSESNRTVEVIKPNNGGYSGIIEIPKKVICDNKTYTVTEIDEGAFNRCTGLTNVTFPESLTTIESWAFENCTGLTNVTFPESLTTIGYFAFNGCTGLTNVSLPESLINFGVCAFGRCTKLENIDVSSYNSVYSSSEGILYNKVLRRLICCPAGKNNVDLPESLTSIYTYAFCGCIGLTNVTFPKSLTKIGAHAFEECTGLTDVIFPESLSTIGASAFEDCSGLTNVTFPESQITIGDAAFENCKSLREINIKNSTPIRCNPGFSDGNLMSTILYVPRGCMEEYEKVYPWNEFWNIDEKDFTTGINSPEVENGTVIRYHVNGGTLVLEGLGADERIEVCDMTGRIVYNGREHTIDNLAPGIYIVKAGDNTLKIRI